MQQPRFWFNDPTNPGLLSKALLPLAALWRLASDRRMKNGPWNKAEVPVICVGNINIGGTGKTPLVIALLERLKSKGYTPHVVSRGYGGTLQGPVKVYENKHTAAQVGDEPLLLSAFGHAWIARDRWAGVAEAVKQGADVIILDDGFQNPSVTKDISIVVVDAATGFGNGQIFPAGPLRETLTNGMARADLVMLIGPEKDRVQFRKTWGPQISVPVIEASLKPLTTGMVWQDQKFLAFAGIGRPEKFFATLRELGARLVRTEALDDHQPLSTILMQRLEAEAFAKDAQLVTTEKDAVRLPPEFGNRVITLPVRLNVQGWGVIDDLLAGL